MLLLLQIMNWRLIKQFISRDEIRKVPEITILFWVVKLLTTAMGESTSDYMVHHIDPIIAVLIGAFAFGIAIILQFWARKYIAWTYWLAVTMVAVFGTMAADVVHIVLGVPYLASTIVFTILLVIVFIVWHRTEHTLSIHSVSTPRREFFYWFTVGTTFALGTAAGDMTAITLGWGYLGSGILFVVLFALPLLAQKWLKVNEVFTFWAAYIVTRPLGASFADWIGKPQSLSGLGIGAVWVSLFLTVLIVGIVGYLTVSRKEVRIKQ